MSATRVELRGVSARYPESALVLRQVSLDVEPGQLMALLGASGCGKTTVLRVIAGLLTPEGGEVAFGGSVVTRLPAERREAVMVFQKPLLFPHLSVEGNVAFGLRMRGIAAAEQGRRVAEALDQVQLPGFGPRRPAELSGGQEQRVALARALITRPRVLLLDEPFSALDEHLRGEMRTLLRRLQRDLALTTVFVTHDQQEAAQVADRIALMLDGTVAQAGAVRDFFERPASPGVARFFGWQTLDGQRWCRPEHVRLLSSGEDGELARIVDHLDAGTHRLVRFVTSTGHSAEAWTDPREAVPAGEICFRVEPDRVVRFDGSAE